MPKTKKRKVVRKSHRSVYSTSTSRSVKPRKAAPKKRKKSSRRSGGSSTDIDYNAAVKGAMAIGLVSAVAKGIK